MGKIWQVGSGDYGRDYSWLFLKHDVMLIGRGDPGRYDRHKYLAAAAKGELTRFAANQLRRFCEGAKPGDKVLLRNGRKVVSVGVVESGYDWTATFDDVYGWNLQHTRRVVWQRHVEKDLSRIQRSRPLFHYMKEIPTFTAVHVKKVLDPMSPLFARFKARRPAKLPPEPPGLLEPEELGRELFAKGLANDAVDKVLSYVDRQRRMIEWYRIHGRASDRPLEHEVVAHMILPLLLALGWSEQLLAVEWHRNDIALFDSTPTTAANCVLVCEAKGLRQGLQSALEQAKKSVQKNNLRRCSRILLANGARFYLYQKKRGGWNNEPVGYINIEKIRKDHVAPPNTSAVDTIMALTPAGAMKRL